MLGVLLAVAAAVTVGTVSFLVDRWRGDHTEIQLPQQLVTGPMSETDKKMQERTREVIHETFGEDVVASVKEMKSSERVQAAEDFTRKLAEEYEVDVEFGFYGDTKEKCGYYSDTEKKIHLNVSDLLEDNEELLPVRIHEFLDTVIHELRHAVQCKAIREEGFWDVENERRILWADNFRNYISADVDPRGYAEQRVEVDARTFAAESLEGVF